MGYPSILSLHSHLCHTDKRFSSIQDSGPTCDLPATRSWGGGLKQLGRGGCNSCIGAEDALREEVASSIGFVLDALAFSEISRFSPWLDTRQRAVAHDFRLGRVRGGALGSRIVLVSWDLNKSELNERYADQALRPSVVPRQGVLCAAVWCFLELQRPVRYEKACKSQRYVRHTHRRPRRCLMGTGVD